VLQSECLINRLKVSDLLVGLKRAEFLDYVCNPELHHHACRLYLRYLVQQRFELLDVSWRFVQTGIEVSDKFLGRFEVSRCDLAKDTAVTLHPTVCLSLEGIDDRSEGHGEEKSDFFLRHVLIHLPLVLVAGHFGL